MDHPRTLYRIPTAESTAQNHHLTTKDSHFLLTLSLSMVIGYNRLLLFGWLFGWLSQTTFVR